MLTDDTSGLGVDVCFRSAPGHRSAPAVTWAAVNSAAPPAGAAAKRPGPARRPDVPGSQGALSAMPVPRLDTGVLPPPHAVDTRQFRCTAAVTATAHRVSVGLGEEWSKPDVAGRAAWRHDPSGVLFPGLHGIAGRSPVRGSRPGLSLAVRMPELPAA